MPRRHVQLPLINTDHRARGCTIPRKALPSAVPSALKSENSLESSPQPSTQVADLCEYPPSSTQNTEPFGSTHYVDSGTDLSDYASGPEEPQDLLSSSPDRRTSQTSLAHSYEKLVNYYSFDWDQQSTKSSSASVSSQQGICGSPEATGKDQTPCTTCPSTSPNPIRSSPSVLHRIQPVKELPSKFKNRFSRLFGDRTASI